MITEHIDNIDAAVFSGDMLYDNELRDTLKEHCERWLRAIEAHEDFMADEALSNHAATA